MFDVLILGNDWKGLQLAMQAARRYCWVGIVMPPMSWRAPFWKFHGEQSQHAFNQSLDDAVNSFRVKTLDELCGLGISIVEGDPEVLSPRKVTTHNCCLPAQISVIATGTTIKTEAIPAEFTKEFVITSLTELESLPESLTIFASRSQHLRDAALLLHSGVEVKTFAERSLASEICLPIQNSILYEDPLHFSKSHGKPVVHFRDIAGSRHRQTMLLTTEKIYLPGQEIGRTQTLNLSTVGLISDESGKLWCNQFGQTWVPQLFGIGDVVGFPKSLQTEDVLEGILAELEVQRSSVNSLFGNSSSLVESEI